MSNDQDPRPLLQRCIVTVACLLAWRLVYVVPLPIANPDLISWQTGIHVYRSVWALLAGPALPAITAGALGLSPFLDAFLLLWLIWVVSRRMRRRWRRPGVQDEDLGWATLAVAAFIAFGRVDVLVNGDRRVLTNTRGIASMLLLVGGTMAIFGLGTIISRWGAPGGYGVWFLFAVQSLLAGVHSLARVLNLALTPGLIAMVTLYVVLSLALLVSTIWITSGIRPVEVVDSHGKPTDPDVWVPLRLIGGSLVAAVMVPTVLIAMPDWIAPLALRVNPDVVGQYWSSVSPLVFLTIAYGVVYALLIVAAALLAQWFNIDGKWLVRRLKSRGLSLLAPGATRPAAYLEGVAWRVNLVGGLWLAGVVAVVPAIFHLVFGASELTVGGPSFAISAAILVHSARLVRDGVG